jgi:hypothetical protein
MKKIIIFFAVLLLACGCKVIETPRGYIEKEPYPYLFKAVSINACAFTVTETDNEGNADLETWKEAAKNQLTRGKGYQLVAEDKLETGKGSPGWEMVFATEQSGLEYIYYVAVARWDDNFWGIHKLYVIEAAGEKGYIEKDLDAIKRAARSLRY